MGGRGQNRTAWIVDPLLAAVLIFSAFYLIQSSSNILNLETLECAQTAGVFSKLCANVVLLNFVYISEEQCECVVDSLPQTADCV